MYCPKCGKAEQSPDSYCRNCGEFLPDFDKAGKKGLGGLRRKSPDEQIKVSLMLNIFSAIASFSMAILLYARNLGVEGVDFSVYLAAALLLAIGTWQIIIFAANLRLRNHFNRRKRNAVPENTVAAQNTVLLTGNNQPVLSAAETNEFIVAPPSVLEETTRNFEKVPRK